MYKFDKANKEINKSREFVKEVSEVTLHCWDPRTDFSRKKFRQAVRRASRAPSRSDTAITSRTKWCFELVQYSGWLLTYDTGWLFTYASDRLQMLNAHACATRAELP